MLFIRFFVRVFGVVLFFLFVCFCGGVFCLCFCFVFFSTEVQILSSVLFLL